MRTLTTEDVRAVTTELEKVLAPFLERFPNANRDVAEDYSKKEAAQKLSKSYDWLCLKIRIGKIKTTATGRVPHSEILRLKEAKKHK